MTNLTRTRMERIILLDQAIRSGRYPNCSSFAKSIAASFGYASPPDRRTILRDIDFLRYMLRAPIEWSYASKGYYYSDNTWKLPSAISLTESEMLHLLLAGQMAELYQETPLAESLSGLFSKLEMVLSEQVGAEPLLLRRKVSFHGPPMRPISPGVWAAVFNALRNETSLDIEYQRPSDAKPLERRIDPIHLANVEGEWYIVGFCHERKEIRHFALSRIKSAKDSGRSFDSPDSFNPDQYFANRFGRFLGVPGKKPFTVVVRFTAEASPWIMERSWHPRQKIKKMKGGGVELTLPMPSLLEAKHWIMGWGKEAEVLEPEELRKML